MVSRTRPQGVAQVVAQLSVSVVRAARTEDPQILAVAAALATMPARLIERDLSRWEDDYWAAALTVVPHRSPMDRLEAVFEFGSRNLFCAFDIVGTAQAYASLAQTLRADGVHAPAHADVSGW